jgi:hypothetical protein
VHDVGIRAQEWMMLELWNAIEKLAPWFELEYKEKKCSAEGIEFGEGRHPWNLTLNG